MLLRALLILIGEISALGQAAPVNAETECLVRLRMVHEALEAWRRAHRGEYPPTLGALVDTGFLWDPNAITCPKAQQQRLLSAVPKDVLTSTLLDRKATYEYELEQEVRPNDRDAQGMAIPRRRAWKEAILKGSLGDVMPILRCLKHDKGFLNIPRTGRSYRSELNWEYQFVDLLPEVYAMPWLATQRSPSIHQYAGARPAHLPAGCLDLKDMANALPGDPWLEGSALSDSLAELAKPAAPGERDAVGQRFDCRYLVQVQGSFGDGRAWEALQQFGGPSYPRISKPLSFRCRPGTRLSLLHATAYPAPDGDETGFLHLTFATGGEQKIVLRYGENTAVWRKAEPSPGLAPVWTGRTGQFNRTAQLYLLTVTLNPPSGGETMAELRLEAQAESPAGPFLVGVNIDSF